MKLKVEINCREHFTLEGYHNVPFSIDTNWFKGRCELVTFTIEELLATKLRALYQRKQGRDLFDLDRALKHHDTSPQKIAIVFAEYIKRGGHSVSKDEFLRNVDEKLNDDEFQGDITSLLRPQVEFQFAAGWDNIRSNVILLL